jgi:hypothetical protein
VTVRDALDARRAASLILEDLDRDRDPGDAEAEADVDNFIVRLSSAHALIAIAHELAEIRKVLEARP